MSPKKRRTGGGQNCPLDGEKPEGDKIVPSIERNRRGTKLSPKKKRKRGGQNCPLDGEKPEGDKIVP